MIDAQLVTFIFVAAALTLTPGADTMLVVRNVLRGGRRDGVVTTVGICSGLFVHATLSALGVSMLLLHSATAFHMVKLAGAGYLVWLGLQSVIGQGYRGRNLSQRPLTTGLRAWSHPSGVSWKAFCPMC